MDVETKAMIMRRNKIGFKDDVKIKKRERERERVKRRK